MLVMPMHLLVHLPTAWRIAGVLVSQLGIAEPEIKGSLLHSIDGVYKKQQTAIQWRERGRDSENIEQILEILLYKSDKIYFRLKYEDPMRSKNYGIWGIAELVNERFVYKYNESASGVFEFHIFIREKDVVARWNGNTPTHYSDFREFTFPYSMRRQINYKDKILHSAQYKAAVAEE